MGRAHSSILLTHEKIRALEERQREAFIMYFRRMYVSTKLAKRSNTPSAQTSLPSLHLALRVQRDRDPLPLPPLDLLPFRPDSTLDGITLRARVELSLVLGNPPSRPASTPSSSSTSDKPCPRPSLSPSTQPSSSRRISLRSSVGVRSGVQGDGCDGCLVEGGIVFSLTRRSRCGGILRLGVDGESRSRDVGGLVQLASGSSTSRPGRSSSGGLGPRTSSNVGLPQSPSISPILLSVRLVPLESDSSSLLEVGLRLLGRSLLLGGSGRVRRVRLGFVVSLRDVGGFLGEGGGIVRGSDCFGLRFRVEREVGRHEGWSGRGGFDGFGFRGDCCGWGEGRRKSRDFELHKESPFVVMRFFSESLFISPP